MVKPVQPVYETNVGAEKCWVVYKQGFYVKGLQRCYSHRLPPGPPLEPEASGAAHLQL